jgi:hypothetical protein
MQLLPVREQGVEVYSKLRLHMLGNLPETAQFIYKKFQSDKPVPHFK